jgi:hypothetical protein
MSSLNMPLLYPTYCLLCSTVTVCPRLVRNLSYPIVAIKMMWAPLQSWQDWTKRKRDEGCYSVKLKIPRNSCWGGCPFSERASGQFSPSAQYFPPSHSLSPSVETRSLFNQHPSLARSRSIQSSAPYLQWMCLLLSLPSLIIIQIVSIILILRIY